MNDSCLLTEMKIFTVNQSQLVIFKSFRHNSRKRLKLNCEGKLFRKMAQSTVLNTSGLEMINRLDDNYLYLLQFADQPLTKLNKEQQELAKKWLVKIGSISQSIEAKQQRNSYLGKLITSMQGEKLASPFNSPPPSDDLPKAEFDDLSEIAESKQNPEWLQNILKEEEDTTHVGGKNFETYLSAKHFENGRGACAYIAVSVQNEGDKAAWVKIAQNKNKEDLIHRIYQKEIGKLYND